MATNPYFRSNLFGNAEQHLYEDLIIESIKIYGLDFEYVPYEFINEDGIYGEDQLLEYRQAYPTEMYIETVSGFESEDLLTKFGRYADERANLMVSMRRFQQCTNYTLLRPREKDLLYFPLTDSIYEITFVQHDKIFHQVGALPVYSLRINLFNYSHQRIRTGVDYIDKFENMKTFTLKFQMGDGTGRYILSEKVFQGDDIGHASAQGTVIWYNREHKNLTIKDIVGNFDASLPIKGVTSGAILNIEEFDVKELHNEPIADNAQVRDEAEDFVNWDEKNPFGDKGDGS